ncbi:ABC-three component system protein [Micromonospora sp. NPDC048170]|uniref:ABC-three component system protein n=1 Tax=Micromonospora sp. NPDC048170 TaxID=3154819 RepID=UPI0033F814A5
MAGSDIFDASASALGYLHQLRFALLASVREHMNGVNWHVSVEVADDVEVISDENKRWQLKHRAAGTRLTDSSADLWKTLRIWSIAVKNREVDLSKTRFILLTTGEISAGSAAHYMQDESRDVESAIKLLAAAEQKSKSKDAKKNFDAFNALTGEEKRALLARISAVGESLNIDQTRTELLRLCGLAVGRAKAEPFLNRLEGWFNQRSIELMRAPTAAPIDGIEFDEHFTDLQQQFRAENLPIDDDVASLTATRLEYEHRAFVQQLCLIGIKSRRIELAVRDYLRAYTQRSRWSRESLLLPGEISRYERLLTEEWAAHFAEMEEELGLSAAEDEKVKAARKIYEWVDKVARMPIRPECREPFVTKGSFHMLADEQLIGWHPDFEARLISLLEPVGVSRG